MTRHSWELLVLSVVTLAGCVAGDLEIGTPDPGGQSGSASMPAGPPDAPGTPDAPPPPLCYGAFVPVCFNSVADVPTAPVALPDRAVVAVNTDTSTLCDPNNHQAGAYCVIAGAGFRLPAGKTIRAYGSKPLVLLSTSTFELDGVVDVSSNHATSDQRATGAGASPTGLCLPAADHVLRGGCSGYDGYLSGGSNGGAAGPGGGAVAIIATTIRLGGKINASGAGGIGGIAAYIWAGSGGQGGMIVLDTATVTGAGVLFANGGGGGQGGFPGPGPAGQNGGESPAPTVPGAGGNLTTSTAGVGGNGATGGTPAGSAGLSTGPGGGIGAIGGGVGVIRAHGVTTNISPPSSV